MSQLIRSEIDNCPVLSRLLEDSGLKIVDIGGRGKAIASNIAKFCEYFVSEPEIEEAQRLEQALRVEAPWRRVLVMPEAIAGRNGEAQLYLTREPGMSSLLEPDPEETNRIYMGDSFTVVGGATVKTITLEAAAAKYGFADTDLLKLDTQGTELEILQSGPGVLSSVISVLAEANLRPFYRGQAVFSDLDSYMRAQGFSLVTLDRTALRRAGYDSTRYSKRVVAWTHCQYFREPSTLACAPDELLRRRVPQFIALALVSEHFDLAREMVDTAAHRRLYSDDDIVRLSREVSHVTLFGTTRMLKKAHKLGIENEVMSPSARDRRRLGG